MNWVYYDLGLLIYFTLTLSWFDQVLQVSSQYLILLSFLSSVMIKCVFNLYFTQKNKKSSNKSGSEKISCFCDEHLLEKQVWKINMNSETGFIDGKNISMNDLIEFLRDDCDEKETQGLDERQLIEKLLQNIILKDDYILDCSLPENASNKQASSLRYYPLEQIFEIFKSFNISKINSLIEIGFIISENVDNVKISKVFIRQYETNSNVYEMTFLHTKIEKKVISFKMNANTKIIKLCKIAEEVKNIIMMIVRACNNSNNEGNLKNDRPLDTDHKKTLEHVKSLSDSLLIQIENLNTFAKFENEVTPQAIELVPALESCLEIFKNKQKLEINKNNLEIALQYDCNKDFKIVTNEAKLIQIVMNLLSNAYKFTASGQIILRAAHLKQEKKMRISVSDTGCGILDSEKIALEKNENSNIGLGLPIVKELLHQMGSDLKFKSSKNEGSIFWFDVKISKRRLTGKSSKMPSVQDEFYYKDKCAIENTILTENAIKLIENTNNNSSEILTFSPSLCPLEMSRDIHLNENLVISTKSQLETLQDSDINLTKKINPSKFQKFDNINKLTKVKKKSQNTIMVDFQDDIEVEEDNIIEYINCKYNQKSINDLKMKDLKRESKLESSEEIENRKRSYKTSQFSLPDFEHTINEEVCPPNNITLEEQLKLKTIMNIIVCDDERTTLYATSNMIKKVTLSKNIEVNIITCSNGIECLWEICKGYTEKKYIDVVFIDESMPFMRGSLVTNIIKTMSLEKQICDTLVYVVTGYEDEKNIKMIKSRKCDGILQKPITATRLKDILI